MTLLVCLHAWYLCQFHKYIQLVLQNNYDCFGIRNKLIFIPHFIFFSLLISVRLYSNKQNYSKHFKQKDISSRNLTKSLERLERIRWPLLKLLVQGEENQDLPQNLQLSYVSIEVLTKIVHLCPYRLFLLDKKQHTSKMASAFLLPHQSVEFIKLVKISLHFSRRFWKILVFSITFSVEQGTQEILRTKQKYLT